MSSEWLKDARFARGSSAGLTQEFKPYSVKTREIDSYTPDPDRSISELSAESSQVNGEFYSRDQLEQEKAQAVQRAEEELIAEQTENSRKKESELRVEFDKFLEAMTRNLVEKEPLYEAVRQLSLAFAQEIALHYFVSDQCDYEAVLEQTLKDSEIGLKEDLEFFVSRSWKEKISYVGLERVLSHIVINADDNLEDGDVVIRSKEAVVSNLVSERVLDLKKQLAEIRYGDDDSAYIVESNADSVEASLSNPRETNRETPDTENIQSESIGDSDISENGPKEEQDSNG